MTTKERIVYESLKLFSDNGFEAVSTRMIAKAIGASDAVIYKHFRSKQEILDQIIGQCTARYLEKRNSVKLETLCWKDVEKICLDMFRFQTTDEWTTMFRKLLLIEQYKNSDMAALYRRLFIDGPIESLAALFGELMKMGYMKHGTAEVYAMELYGPFFLYHTTDGNSETVLKFLTEHVRRFRENVVTEKIYL